MESGKKAPTIYLANPTQDGWVLKDTSQHVHQHPSNDFNLMIGGKTGSGSLLGVNFNTEWATALTLAEEGKVTHFAMLHADIIPEENWLGILLEEMEASGAHILSATVAIKDYSGDSSTAIGWPDDPWHVERLSLSRTLELPGTFSIDDCGQPGQVLLVNSGCMLIDLRSGWAHELDENNCLKHYFTIHDRILRGEDGKYEVGVMSEDWNISRTAAASGCRVMATSKVFNIHRGMIGYRNRPVDDVPDTQAIGVDEPALEPALAGKE